MYDSAWSTSVSNQLTVFDDNLFALHFSDANSTTVGITGAQERWLLVLVVGRLGLMVVLLRLLLLLVLIAKIVIVVVVDVVMVGMIGGAATGAMIVVLVVSTDVVLILIVAAVVIVLVVGGRCGCEAGRRRRCWWRYEYVVLIFRKIQIVVDVVVLATVVLLEHAVGVLDTWRVRRMLVGGGVVEILILFQIVDEWTPFGVGGSTGAATTGAAAAVGVVFEYPNRAGMVVQQLFLVVEGFRCRPWLLTGVVVVVTAGGMGVGVGIRTGMFPVFVAGSGLEISLRRGIVMGFYRLQRMRLLLVVVAV